MTGALEQRIRSMADEADLLMNVNVHQHAALAERMREMTDGAGPLARALAARTMGNSLRLRGRLDEALGTLRQALALFREAGEEVEWARTQTALLPVLVFLGRSAEAIRAAQAGLAIFLEHGEDLPAARLLNNTAMMHGNMGRPTEALNCLVQADELAARAGDEALRTRMRLTRALVLQQLGRHAESVSECALALRLATQPRQAVLNARILQAGAIGVFHMGRFGKALRRFVKARTLFETESSRRDVLVCDLYICHCYVELNRCDQALTRVRQVLAELDPAQAGFQCASARLYEGMALARLGRSDEALRALEEANAWFKRHGHAPWAGKSLLEQAQVFLRRGMVARAILAARQSERLMAAARMSAEEARAALVRAEGLLLINRTRLAEAAASRAYRVVRQAGMPGLAFRSLHLLGRIAMQRQEWEAARRYLTQAVRTAERMRATVQVAFRQAFLDDKSSAYADLVWLHLSQGRLRTAHRLADRAKSRALVDLLAAVHRPGRSAAGADEQRLLARIEAARREYQVLSAPAQLGPEEAIMVRTGSAPISVQRAQAEERLAALWDEWELRRLSRLGIGLAGERVHPRLYRSLPPRTCMVEYFIAGAQVVAMVSDRRGLQGWVRLGGADAVRRSLDLLQLNLDLVLGSSGAVQPPAGLARNARALLHDMHGKIWQPLLPMLQGCTGAVIIPHGILHQVPFEALYDGERYMAEYLEISVAPSREVWAHCREQAARSGTGRDLVLGYNADGSLPYVDEEVRWVARVLGTEPVTGTDAVASRLAEAGPSRVVHLAVHGEFRGDNPHFSTLLLADGTFTAADAASLRLSSTLVVLSGCETGLSRFTPGGELLGMLSAFLLAGSSSVLASRWRVDDCVTAELMQRFYERLLAGHGKAAALREAQAEMAARQIHPLYWAAFYLVGDSGPMILTTQEPEGFSQCSTHTAPMK